MRDSLRRSRPNANRRKPRRGPGDKAHASARPRRDEARLVWVRRLPCLACFPELLQNVHEAVSFAGPPRSEAAHVGQRGLAQKCRDDETIPLCPEHHRTGKDAHHVLGKGFWKHHGLDRELALKLLNEAYYGA